MLKKGLAVVAVLALALVAAAWFALRTRARQAGERLVARAVELDAKTYPRASHAPEPGTFGERLEAALKGHTHDKLWIDTCTAVARSDAPLEALPADCAAAYERDRDWARSAIMAARAESWSRYPGDVISTPLVYATRLAALEVRGLPADDAVERCVDVLALGRDRALGGGLIGLMIAASVVELVAKPCTAALASASPEKGAWAKRAIEGIQSTWPAPADWVPQELVGMSAAFYPVLTREQRARLPANPWAGSFAGEEPGFFEVLVLMNALPGVLAMFERLERAGALEPSKRDVEVAALEAAEATSWNPIRRVAAPSYGRFFARDDAARATLRKLAGAAP